MFQIDDFELLDKLLQTYISIATTPHVLTEVSNHAHHLKGPLGVALVQELADIANMAAERFTHSQALSRNEEFKRFGLTDCALAEYSQEFTVITTDFRLAGYLEAQGRYVVNLNHLRQSRLLP